MARRRRRGITGANSNPSDFVEKEYIEIVQLYALRIILDLGGHKEFIDSYNDLTKDALSYFLELDEFIMKSSDEYQKSDVLDTLKAKYETLLLNEPQLKQTSLYKNIAKLQRYIPIKEEEIRFIAFFVLVRQFEVLEQAVELLGNELNTKQTMRFAAKILDIEQKRLEKIVSKSVLFRSGFVSFDERDRHSLDRKVDFLNSAIPEKLFNPLKNLFDLFSDTFCKLGKPSLKMDDFTHIEKDLKIMLTYLKKSIKKKQEGVNILLYGKPGTGKTELTKLLAKQLKRKLYEVSYIDEDGESIDGSERLKAYKTAQLFLESNEAILLYDEAEDIFQSSRSFFFLAPLMRQKDKAWINRMLESNKVPTVWITNNIDSIDPAIVRRFDYALELPIPPASKREKILKKYTGEILSDKTLKILAKEENIAPAVVSRASKVVASLDTPKKEEEFIHILNNTLKAQGHKEITQNSSASLPSFYDPALVNTSSDLDQLAKGIERTKNARLCLYGPAGTGKSAFGKYVAEVLGKPFILKRGSDLLSKWVGGTEENIARAFEEARREDAVLVFDEVDSFLQERSNARASWEVTQVNEMLVQMENFDGVFIATTNLMENLDKASLRRFDLKLEFGYLKPGQSWEMFRSYTKELGLQKATKSLELRVKALRHLTPGDFAAVARQSRFRPIGNAEELLRRLQEEIEAKQVANGNTMGFLAS